MPTTSPLSKYILLGEDDIDDQELLKEIFLSLDPSFDLVPVNNGKKLLEFMHFVKNDNLPSLIILDYNMPDLNGAEILALLKAELQFDSIPRIVWSTSNSDSYRTMCLQQGADDYIVKPSTFNNLMNAAKHMLSYHHKQG